MATIYPFHFLNVLSHIVHITCWISQEKLVFSDMCLFPGIISCILTSPNIKIQDDHQRPYWKFNSKENSPGNWYNIAFLLIIAHRAHFWHHLCILTGLNVKIKDGRHLSFPLFSDLSHSIHCSCWMSNQKGFQAISVNSVSCFCTYSRNDHQEK